MHQPWTVIRMDHRSLFLRLFLIRFVVHLVAAFSPQDLLSLPQRGPAIPNPDGDVAVFIQNHISTSGVIHSSLFLISLECESSEAPVNIVDAHSLGDPCWLDKTTILYRSEENGHTALRTYDTFSRMDRCLYTFTGAIKGLKAKSVGGHARLAFSTQVDKAGFPVKLNDTTRSQPLLYDQLYVRFWDEWITTKSTIFSGTLVRTSDSGGYEIHDMPVNILNVTEELRCLESPTRLGGIDDYAVSVNSLSFVAHDPLLNPATTTTSNVYIVDFNPSSIAVVKVNDVGGCSFGPIWSHDDRFLAYLETPTRTYHRSYLIVSNISNTSGFRLVVLNRCSGQHIYLTEEWHHSPSAVFWSSDGASLYVLARNYGRTKIFQIELNATETMKPIPLSNDFSVVAAFAAQDSLVLTQSSFTDSYILQKYSSRKRHSCQVFAQTPDLPLSHHSIREFWYHGYNDHPVHGFLHLPENFHQSQKYPLAVLIHGGPQSAWEDAWSIQWNSAVFANAGAGWIVAMINPTGSAGYGQDFQDSIRGN